MRLPLSLIAAMCIAAFSSVGAASAASLTPVYTNADFQITGVTVSKSGRLFVNFPRWSDRYLNAVVEVMKDGSVKPYPDESWNRWDSKPETAGQKFVCVQSVVADNAGSLFVVDPGAPMLGPVVPGAAKLVKIDLKTNRVNHVYLFGADVIKPTSYLNDVRIDNRRNVAYMTDSGTGGFVIVDLASGKAHRALDGHPSVQVEPGVTISVNGKPVQENGKPPQFKSDGIALSPDGDYLYYQALTGATLYRVKTSALRDSPDAAGNSVEKAAKTFPVDGLWIDSHGTVFLSNLNESAVYKLAPGGQPQKVVQSEKLQWPDTFSQGPDGMIYITSSHTNDMPRFNQGKGTLTEPYAVFKFQP